MLTYHNRLSCLLFGDLQCKGHEFLTIDHRYSDFCVAPNPVFVASMSHKCLLFNVLLRDGAHGDELAASLL